MKINDDALLTSGFRLYAEASKELLESRTKPLSAEEIRRVMSALGKKGGSAKSDAKLSASRTNGLKGGRPKNSVSRARPDIPKSES